MSERKVLQKYYPADFDPRNITRSRGPKQTGPRIQTVRLMAPFSMKCLTCGEFVYRGRKFNSRKVTDQSQKYLNIQIFSFHIKCTRCSAEIIFRTDPKNKDYAMVRGAMRTMEPWRSRDGGCCDGRGQDKDEEETLDARLDRLEREEAEAAGESGEAANAMEELEAQNQDARREMAAADALDEIRQRNARANRSELDDVDFAERMAHEADEERSRQDAEDAAVARRAFGAGILVGELPSVPVSVVEKRDVEETKLACDAAAMGSTDLLDVEAATTMRPSFKRTAKKKTNHSAQLGIKIKTL